MGAALFVGGTGDGVALYYYNKETIMRTSQINTENKANISQKTVYLIGSHC